MAQSVYVAFCETFPDSYKQFNDDFKEFLLQIVFEWMTGKLPLNIAVPRYIHVFVYFTLINYGYT